MNWTNIRTLVGFVVGAALGGFVAVKLGASASTLALAIVVTGRVLAPVARYLLTILDIVSDG